MAVIVWGPQRSTKNSPMNLTINSTMSSAQGLNSASVADDASVSISTQIVPIAVVGTPRGVAEQVPEPELTTEGDGKAD